MEKGLINNVKQIYLYVDELKKVRNELITNFYFDIEKLALLVDKHELIYGYKEGCYLNLLYEEDGFLRLYFFIVDIDEFSVEQKEVIICDLFIMQKDEQFNKVADKLSKCNFSQYACIQKWRAKSPKQLLASIAREFVFGYDKEPEAINMIFDIFDKYTDYLPRKCEVDAFLVGKNFINIYRKENNRFLGSLIYSQRGKEFTIELYFVRPDERGKRISYLLHDHFYQNFAKEGVKFVSWINIENKESILIHQRYHYQRAKLKKYTFLRNGVEY